jgi:hypothetical protein
MSIYLLNDDFDALATAAGVLPYASLREDAFAQFVHFNGSVSDFFKARREDKAHWFELPKPDASEHAALHSLTAQGQYAREHGQAALEQLLGSAGLKLGQIKAAPKNDAVPDNSTNPYSPKFHGTPAEREAAINGLIRRLGTAKATTYAHGQGYQVDGRPLARAGARV